MYWKSRLPSAVVVCLSLVSCGERGATGASPGAAARTAAESSTVVSPLAALARDAGELPAIAGEQVVQLDVDGFGPLTVQVPVGAAGRRPVVVALHAHDVRPERACADWRRASGDWPFVVCPFGMPANAGKGAPVTVGTAEYTTREIEAGLSVLRRQYPVHADTTTVVFAGYSLGAKVGAQVVGRLGTKVSAAVFGEGGYDTLTPGVVGGYARAGLQRALLLCSTRACELSFEPVAGRFRSAGIAVRIASAGGTKHPFQGEVVEVARRSWPWLVEDDPRFHEKGNEELKP